MKPIAIVGVLIVVIIVIGGVYYLSSSSQHSAYTTQPYTTQQYSTSQYSTTVQQSSAPTTSNPTTTVQQSTTTIVANTTKQFTVSIEQSQSLGSYIANGTGESLYIYTQDTQNGGSSSCNGGCATAWPPFTPSNLTVPTGLNSSQFKFITRTGGASQLTFNGYPLYYYFGDSKPGQTNGERSNNFYLISPSGQIIR